MPSDGYLLGKEEVQAQARMWEEYKRKGPDAATRDYGRGSDYTTYARILTDEGDGKYTAEEVQFLWNGTAYEWVTTTQSLVWNGAIRQRYLYELNGQEGVAVGQIVAVSYEVDEVSMFTTGGGVGVGAIIAKTTGGPTNGEYPCDFYADGKHEASTGSGTCEVLMLNMSEDLPAGTWIVCHPTTVQITGGA